MLHDSNEHLRSLPAVGMPVGGPAYPSLPCEAAGQQNGAWVESDDEDLLDSGDEYVKNLKVGGILFCCRRCDYFWYLSVPQCLHGCTFHSHSATRLSIIHPNPSDIQVTSPFSSPHAFEHSVHVPRLSDIHPSIHSSSFLSIGADLLL